MVLLFFCKIIFYIYCWGTPASATAASGGGGDGFRDARRDALTCCHAAAF